MWERAEAFLEAFDWCQAVVESHLGNVVIGGVVAVFLFRIEPARPDVDEWLWIVVGDLPPAYLVTDDTPNPACALDSYIELMSEWVDAARTGGPTDALIPVLTSGGEGRLPPTTANADMLHSRLMFLGERILGDYRADLQACP